MTLADLLNNLPRFFDAAANPLLALRVRHQDGLRWQIDNANTLTLWVGDASPVTIDLAAGTLGSLADQLVEDGYEVPYRNEELMGFRASRLYPGAGDQDSSNGDHWLAWDSLLWAHGQALAEPLAEAQSQLATMLRQLLLPQAREAWADEWGGRFGVARIAGEADGDYTQRIIQELSRTRNNPIGMQVSAALRVPATVTIFEPWQWMFRLDRHKLSGRAALPGAFHQYHVLQPRVAACRDWAKLLTVLSDDRPAGSLIWNIIYRPGVRAITLGYAQWGLASGRTRWYPRLMRLYRGERLSMELTLSMSSAPKNTLLRLHPDRVRLIRRSATVVRAEAGTWHGPWDDRSWFNSGAGIIIDRRHSSVSWSEVAWEGAWDNRRWNGRP